jgi:hypothetical protein
LEDLQEKNNIKAKAAIKYVVKILIFLIVIKGCLPILN